MKAIIALVAALLLVHTEEAIAGSETSGIPSLGLIEETRNKEVPFKLPERFDEFYQRFSGKSRSKFEEQVFYKANPLQMKFHDLKTTDPDDFLMTKGYVISSMKYSIREFTVDSSLVQDSQDWFRGLFEGVVGNTGEEEITIAQNHNLEGSEEFWRRKIDSDRFLWGVRLLRWPNPYVYVSGRLGHYDGEEIFLWHVRYYMQRFKNQRVEGLISMPLPSDYFLSTGILYSPSDDYQKIGHVYVGTLRLEKWFPDRLGAMFFGIELYKKMDVTAGIYYEF